MPSNDNAKVMKTYLHHDLKNNSKLCKCYYVLALILSAYDAWSNHPNYPMNSVLLLSSFYNVHFVACHL